MSFDTYCERFAFAVDMNGDHAFTVTDVGLMLKAVFMLPSTAAASILHHFDVTARFFEVDCSFGKGWGGGFFALLAWFLLLNVISEANANGRNRAAR